MSFANIPDELKTLPQWCVWRWEDIGTKKPNKPPYNPITRQFASVSDPSTWVTFEQAIDNKFSTQIWNESEDVKTTGYTGIGMVLSENDPYSLIDLDSTEGDQIAHRRQIEIFREFDSYSEISPSGNGLHIIVRGSVLAGRKRSYLEIYSSRRYATFTGNVYPKDQPKPIRDCQDKLMQLWHQMGDGPIAHNMYQGDERERYTDDQILSQCRDADNGEKFSRLYSGEWNYYYPSQSEGDFALIDIIAFYTKNRNQIQRLFSSSALGQRDKAKRSDYLSWMINKSFDRMLPPIDFDGFKNQLELKLAQDKLQAIIIEPTLPGIAPVPITIPQPSTVQLPPGLLGELASFIYAAAPRPVPEIALAGAIGLMAGIVGRAYNISKTGLNHYVLVLTKTGRGKEAAATGIDMIMNDVMKWCPTASRFRGPAIISSGQALIRHLATVSNCFVSVLGEFGITIERISNKRAVPSDKMLYQMLLDLYNKSGHGQTLQASAYSKKENDVAGTRSPALTIFGESTHKLFYEALSEDMIAAGLLPRFLIIDYEGDRVLMNDNHEFAKPDPFMIDKLTSLVSYVEQITKRDSVITVGRTPDAIKMLKQFDVYTTSLINKERNDVIVELWNRAHMKVLRLAALVAVGINHLEPMVTVENVEYAMRLIQNDINLLSSKFEAGLIGASSEESKQQQDLIRVIKDFIVRDWEYNKKYCQGKTDKKLYDEKIVPYAYLNKRLVATSSFRLDRSGATNALKRTIQLLIDSDRIRESTKSEHLTKMCGTTQRCFVITDTSILDI